MEKLTKHSIIEVERNDTWKIASFNAFHTNDHLIHFEDEGATTHKIRIVDDDTLLNVETNELHRWRYLDIEENKPFVFSCNDANQLKTQVDDLIRTLIIDVLEKQRTTIDNLSPHSLQLFTSKTLAFSNELSKNIMKHFVNENGEMINKETFLNKNDVQTIFENVVNNIYK